jgi:bleomycin hydrolase
MEKYISKENLETFSQDFNSSRTNKIAMNAAISVGVNPAASRWTARKDFVHQYSVRVDHKGITNQKQSGRCWMFAALNCLRYHVIQNLNLDDFELSQNYTCFYDKLEKANYFLECILQTLDEPEDSRYLNHLCRSPIQDGGQWDMISSIVAKYGIVPKSAMPESACSSATSEMNGIVTKKLREFAAVLRKEHKNGKSIDELREIKTQQMCTVYRMLSICLGTPPETFDFEVLTKDKEFISDKNITPKEFFDKYVKVDLSQYVSLINSPTEDKPYMHSYTVKFLGNVIDGTPVRYVNLPIEELKKAAIAQMKDNEPVWFGCDVGKRSARDSGVMSLEAYDYDNFFSTTFDLSKAEGLDYGYSMMTHAMVFQGVDLDENGNPTKWCVENSWGPDAGNKGMYMMTDSWFDKYMYQIVVQKKYLSPEILAAYEAEPIVLEPWDPMGALA